MYHEVTYQDIARQRRNRIIAAVVAVIIAIALVVAFMAASAIGREQGTVTLRESVLDAAKQCCAVEGSYPSSLSHLEQRYGLVVNRADYDVRYEWLGDNVLPSVVVTLR
ncbi:MAG: hypothetical protein Q4D27_01815 [Coriobacteriia bacterium]|nr:hypothetical protein [Coriobacteriia bacterium]